MDVARIAEVPCVGVHYCTCTVGNGATNSSRYCAEERTTTCRVCSCFFGGAIRPHIEFAPRGQAGPRPGGEKSGPDGKGQGRPRRDSPGAHSHVSNLAKGSSGSYLTVSLD